MYNNFEVEKVKEDGTKLDIRVILIDGKFRINNVGVKPKGKRKFTYLMGSIQDNYSYRSLDMKDRREFELKRFIEVCGIELLNEALQEAWMSIKPDELKFS